MGIDYEIPNNSGNHNANVIQCTGFKMPTGATNGYVMKCLNAAGDGYWAPGWAWNTAHTADANTVILVKHEDNAASTSVALTGTSTGTIAATANTNLIYDATGKFNGCFYANDTYYAIGDAQLRADFDTAASAQKLTIEWWFKADTNDWSAAAGDQTFFSARDAAIADSVYFEYYGASNKIDFGWKGSGTTDTLSYTPGLAPIDTTDWAHMAVTIDTGAADEMCLFVNGVKFGTTAGTLGEWGGGCSGFWLYNNTQVSTRVCDGRFDEFAISNKIRY